MKSAWADPSFSGARLPVERRVDADGFSATWRAIDLNRGHNHEWVGSAEDSKFMASARGVKLLVTADMYQQTERSVKYAALFIALNLHVADIRREALRVKAHPLQYLLIGLALVVFYSLLLSLSEQLGFGRRILLSAAAVVCLIALYARAVFRSLKPSLAIGAITTSLYAYLYTLSRWRTIRCTSKPRPSSRPSPH
jgi:inner membrane protein